MEKRNCFRSQWRKGTAFEALYWIIAGSRMVRFLVCWEQETCMPVLVLLAYGVGLGIIARRGEEVKCQTIIESLLLAGTRGTQEPPSVASVPHSSTY
jgi:hypothetical protein